MPELRKDYILNRYVIIATERGKRPDQFKAKKTSKQVKNCFFCPGNENLTPPEIGRQLLDASDVKGWSIRYFPNKFPAVHQEGKPDITTDNDFFTYADAFGVHEVIVETPDHNKELADLSPDYISEILKIYKQRIEILSEFPGVKYVTVFKNHGETAGTSIIHTHSQIIAYNIVPVIIQEKEEKSGKDCPYCKIINIEKNSFRRCFENNSMIAFTPYASRFPFEIWIFPKRHVINITRFNEDEFIELAEILKKVLLKLKELNAPYNMYLHYGIEKLHFQIVIAPRLAKWAGFEFSTGTIINSMPPEKAAEFYRG
ncbi:galactose-1-phosphate uridylyltransferase [Candidatus Woesearchaeota archaeon]|nr:galactose-1-phosphate uridylyltransferase [Candidatus Woesearchaeota archaeon]